MRAPGAGGYDRKGLLLGAGAYLSWVVLPIYFKVVGVVPPLQILFSRIVYALLFMLLVITWRRRWGALGAIGRSGQRRRVLLIYGSAALLLASNWYIYIWAVNNGHILEGSLGYFINPLLNVLLGVLFLRERLRPGQWAALAVATLGVAYLTWNYGHLPWIALSLAGTFGVYGLVKKLAPLPAEEGLTLETAMLVLPALVGMLWFEAGRAAPWPGGEVRMQLLLMLSGPITAVPLLMFAAAAQRVPLSMLGVLQYVAPTGQFLVAVLLYNEPFPPYKLVGFSIVWVALLLFWGEAWWAHRRPPAVQPFTATP